MVLSLAPFLKEQEIQIRKKLQIFENIFYGHGTRIIPSENASPFLFVQTLRERMNGT